MTARADSRDLRQGHARDLRVQHRYHPDPEFSATGTSDSSRRGTINEHQRADHYRSAGDRAMDVVISQQHELDRRLWLIQFLSGVALLAVLMLLGLCTIAPARNL